MLTLWIFIFVASLLVLVVGADWLLESAEKIGMHFGLSPFVIGVLITGIGTSLPELASSLSAVFQGANEIVVANAVGSNIANILLVIGISAVVGRRLVITKNLIDLELPLLAISTVLFLGVVYDGVVTETEALFLVLAYTIYLVYTVLNKGEGDDVGTISSMEREIEERITKYKQKFGFILMRPFFIFKDYIMLILGASALFVGAKYLIESVIAISGEIGIATSVISITAVAIGTSLPELLVSIKAVLKKKYETSVGNILGSNAFNALMVVGVPGVFTSLTLDDKTLYIGVPVMALATLLFIISGISRTIHNWEGMMYLVVYVFFILKLFA
jgi:cation:H+ antiporter